MLPISGSAGGGGPSNATSAANSSGWTVNYGAGGVNAGPGSELSQYLPFVVIGAVLLVAALYLKKRR